LTAPALVVLAAGLGSRFGGPKQIAPIGPGGAALIDYTARDALAAGFERLVLVVRGEVAGAIEDHVRRRWPAELRPQFVRQDLEESALAAVRSGRTKPLGTAHAVLVAASVIDGPFGVANADDLYGASGLAILARHLGGGGHVLVGYRLANSLLGERPVNRALCRTDPDGNLTAIVEGEVRTGPGGLTWRPIDAPGEEAQAMTGDEIVSMNLWGFTPEVVPLLGDAFRAFAAGGGIESGAELLLPGVVGDHLGPGGLDVAVLVSEERCLGVTHPDDVPLLRATMTSPAW
jgi:CTP:molybdopterin cytidylyltransferase MocA